jgi:hypothetical protein
MLPSRAALTTKPAAMSALCFHQQNADLSRKSNRSLAIAKNDM